MKNNSIAKIWYAIMVIFLLLALLFLINTTSHGKALYNPQDFNDVEVTNVVDGDTIDVNIFGVNPLIGWDMRIRFNTADAPEIKGDCIEEKIKAMEAKVFTKNRIQQNDGKVILKNCIRGTFFRLICDVYAPNLLSTELLENGLAVPYKKDETKNVWCDK